MPLKDADKMQTDDPDQTALFFIHYHLSFACISFCFLLIRAIPEKNTWGGKTAGDIFFYGWSVRTFFKLYGSLVFDKF